jgi:uncharacterized protein YdaU (DUF1376 family)
MARNGLPYMPLDVDDYLEDEAVIGMSAEAEGCYIRLLCRSWKSKEPGVIPAVLVHELSGLHRVGETERERVLGELSAAFNVSESAWTQKRMQVEWKRANELYKAKKRGALMTNQAKEITRSPHAERTLTATLSERTPGVGLGVGVGKERNGVEVVDQPSAEIDPEAFRRLAPKSTPLASETERQRPRPTRPTIDTEASIVATCQHCRAKFSKPVGSQRQVCPDCHDEGHR